MTDADITASTKSDYDPAPVTVRDSPSAEKREQVFVSSTFLDLRDERQAIIQTLLEADCLPAGMELFPASDKSKWDLIRRVIDDSDYYVVVIGGRYGSVDEDGLSFTEKEFDYAVASGTPVMGFLHGSPGTIPAEKSELDKDARGRLEQFRDKAARKMVKYWTSPAELAGAVALSLIQTRKTHPSEGWVRSRNAMTPAIETEMAQLREQVATLSQELEEHRAAASTAESELAHGSDVFEFPIYVQNWTQAQVAEGQVGIHDSRQSPARARITWDQLFSQLGPLMLDEASSSALDDQLDDIARRWRPNPLPLPDDTGKWERIRAAANVIGDIEVQFNALGYVTPSKKTRVVGDKATYWTLTPAGREHLTRVRAIRKPGK